MPTQKPRNPNALAWRFALGFLALALLVSAAVRADAIWFDGELTAGMNRQVAQVVGGSMGLLGASVDVRGNTIRYGASAFSIATDCTGIEVMGLFAAAVLAFPSTWRRKLKGLAIGLPALMLVNLIRMMSLIFVGATSTRALDLGHHYVWPVIVLALALSIWLAWARSALHGPRALA